jgi:hypothetical protein
VCDSTKAAAAESIAKRARGVDSVGPGCSNSSSVQDVSHDDPAIIPLWFNKLSKAEQAARDQAAHKAWDMFWFVHGLSFNMIESTLFTEAVAATKRCPTFTPCVRQTLAGSHLRARNEDANVFKAKRLDVGMLYGFLYCTDGWRNKRKRSYHNHILISTAGPIFLFLADHTGQSGTAVAIHDEIQTVFDSLESDLAGIIDRIVIICTDTPSANRSSWKLLRLSYPTKVCMGCMAHELGLLFKDWANKIPELKQLFMSFKQITIWVRNHGEILLLFESKVRAAFPNDKRKHKIGLYMPGDTRMATMFKLIHRGLLLKSVLEALVTDSAYVEVAQKAIKSHNLACKVEHRVPLRADGTCVDYVRDTVMDSTVWNLASTFEKAARSALYLHRMVDTFQPCLGKVYYYCAVTAKHLEILAAEGTVVASMRKLFTVRWARWHNPIHTLAYAMDPSFQSHSLTAREKVDCKQMIQVLRPDAYASVLIELNSFKSEPANFCTAEWDAADKYHAYQWWHTFGDVLPSLQHLAIDVLSKAASASACEFNWSAVSSVERKGRASLLPASTNATVNIAANHKLESAITRRGVNNALPTLDQALEDLISEAEDEAPLGNLMGLECVVVPAVAGEDDDEEEDEPPDEQLDRRAQSALYMDWGDRDNLMPSIN